MSGNLPNPEVEFDEYCRNATRTPNSESGFCGDDILSKRVVSSITDSNLVLI